jgi:hypothetical protein
MSYEIKEEGYECRGFKLGQMTNNGKIIGFDTRNISPFIVTDNNIDEHSIVLSESKYVSVILKGYEDSEFSWFGEKELKLVGDSNQEELPPISKTQLNVIHQIRNVIDNATVKVEFFSEEFCISLYNSEIPICWDKQNGVYILTETMSGNLTHDMMIEILDVMKIVDSNLEWFKECMQND